MTNSIIANGVSADVFDVGSGQVLKAFRRRPHTNKEVTEWGDHDAMTRAEFRFEALAYERLRGRSDLEVYAPQYFGRFDPISMLAAVPDAASRYVAGCGILLEYIRGTATKVSRLPEALRSRAEQILERFEEQLKFGHVWDSSCFAPGSRADFTLIDFATWDGFADYQLCLNGAGHLTDALRIRLETENVA